MLVVVVNLSRRKAYRTSKRIISAVLPQITIRLNLGRVPKRVLLELVSKLRNSASRGSCVKIFFEDTKAHHGMKCLEVGKTAAWLNKFIYCESSIDAELALRGWLAKLPLIKLKNKKPDKSGD